MYRQAPKVQYNVLLAFYHFEDTMTQTPRFSLHFYSVEGSEVRGKPLIITGENDGNSN